jgi:hypothetical protein
MPPFPLSPFANDVPANPGHVGRESVLARLFSVVLTPRVTCTQRVRDRDPVGHWPPISNSLGERTAERLDEGVSANDRGITRRFIPVANFQKPARGRKSTAPAYQPEAR